MSVTSSGEAQGETDKDLTIRTSVGGTRIEGQP